MENLLTQEDISKRLEIFHNFQTEWNLEKIENMTLDEYVQLGSTTSFTYTMEKKLHFVPLGDGKAFKFGIYQCKNAPKTKTYKIGEEVYKTLTDGNYAWVSCYGNTADEAFQNIKSKIIDVIKNIQSGNIEGVDKIQELRHNYKWKIAFYFQKPEKLCLFGVVSKEALDTIAQIELHNTNLKTFEIYNQILQKYGKPQSLEALFQLTRKMWLIYNEEEDAYIHSDHKDTQTIQQENHPLNQIFYGSPGTGKTYQTISKSLEILGEDIKNLDRQEQKQLFEKYRKNGQIEFVTFHQNYGYEEFVEGIKPKLDVDNNSGDLEYKIQEGIFKRICNNASYIQEKIDDVLIDTKSRVWKISLGGQNWKDKTKELQEYCFKHNEIRIGWEDASINRESFEKLGSQQKSAVLQFKNEMQIGDLVCVLNSKKTIMAIGIIESNFYYDNESELAKKLEDFYSSRKVKWIDQSIREIYSLNNETELTLKTVYPLTEISPINLLSLIQDKQSENTIDNTNKPYILVIDEINRGNISKIFGELITLIEPSKRIGADEELQVVLPYSQKLFGVPSNLYIIGTMNTADRSITSLDIALRRRFEFVEMMPDAKKLEDICIADVTDEGIEYYEDEYEIKLDQMLQVINDRIEFLYDREKTIGHAFFLSEMQYDEDADCYFIEFNRLKDIFQNKIIPLLQEYFYNDYEAINAVLNDNGMIEVKVDSNKQKTPEYIFKGVFKDFINDRGLDEKKIFQIASKDSLNENGENLWDDPQTYINIYEG